jgi:hypothetical protein
VELAAAGDAGVQLKDVVRFVEGAVEEMPGCREILEQKLAEYGYLERHADLYTERVVVAGVRAYAVREPFPRIHSEHVPAGVSGVEFAIALDALAECECDSVALVGPPFIPLEGTCNE